MKFLRFLNSCRQNLNLNKFLLSAFFIFLGTSVLYSQTENSKDSLSVPKFLYPNTKKQTKFNTTTPVLKWTKIPNANGYILKIDEINGSSSKEIFYSVDYAIISDEEFLMPDSFLKSGESYRIQIKAYNDSNWSSFSKPVTFSIASNVNKLPINQQEKILPPVIISKNNLVLVPNSEKNQNYSLVWNKNNKADFYEITIDGINTSNILGDKYYEVIKDTIADTLYNINPNSLLEYNNYRWRIRSNYKNQWSEYSEYYYFTIEKESEENLAQENIEDLVLRFKYSDYIDEMILAKYADGEVFLPVNEILSILKINHNENIEDKEITSQSLSNSENENSINFTKMEVGNTNGILKFNKSDFIQTELEYYAKTNLLDHLTDGKFTVNMRNLDLKFSTNYKLPFVERLQNQQKLEFNRNNLEDKDYPILFGRKRKNIAGGFFDYSLSGNYVKNEKPYYSFDFGLGGEILGGDAQLFSSHSLFNSKLINNRTEYRWRYAFLNNRNISSITLGNNNSIGLQSYDFQGVSISNEPLELRKLYGRRKITEKSKPFWKAEIYMNNTLIDIVQADDKGNYDFEIPFTYGTTLVEIHNYGPDGEYNFERKMYQIPIEQVPEGDLDYTVNFGNLISTKKNIFQASAAYGINERITTRIGADVFTDDFNNSSMYLKSTARILEGYIANLTIAPNAFYELELNSIFSDLATFNIGTKFYSKNFRFNPTQINNEINANVFFPLSINKSNLSFLFRGNKVSFDDYNRYDLSFRTFYDIENFSPSIEYNYFSLSSNSYSSSFLNFRLNYSFYLPSAIFGGNIIDSRFVYNIKTKKVENFNITFATTLWRNYRVQLSHDINFTSSFSNTQLGIVMDLPFFRSSTNVSKSVISQSAMGSINYNQIFNNFDFHNRGMVGRSAAAVRFFLDENNNNNFDEGETKIENMDVSINSVSNKKQLDDGSIILDDLQSYTKYNVKLIDRKSKNPIWFPVKEKFGFVSDPNQYKEIDIPFYEAAVVNGTVYKEVNNKKIPLEGINIYLRKKDSDEKIKVVTMSDGSFYKYGIEPGEYEIYVDEKQQERLNLKSEPDKIDTTIYSINSENYNDDFEFILK